MGPSMIGGNRPGNPMQSVLFSAGDQRGRKSMMEDDKPRPAATVEAERRQQAQRRRLAEALRDNLLKRKRQSRERDAAPE